MSDPAASTAVTVTLTREEALVLHEWLARVVDDENADGIAETVEDDAEVWALNAVYVALEAELAEPYAEGFDKALKAARRAIVTRAGRWPWDAGDGEA